MSKSDKIDQHLIKALTHPLRVRILEILSEQLASPLEMARLTGQKLGDVSYHTKVLLEYDLLELVRTEPRRGAVEHFYRAKPQADLGSRSWQEVPGPLQQHLAAASLDTFLAHVVPAIATGDLQARKGAAFTCQQLTVDESGWREIVRILQTVEERIHRVAKKCEERSKDPDKGISIVVSLSAFEEKENEEESTT